MNWGSEDLLATQLLVSMSKDKRGLGDVEFADMSLSLLMVVPN